MQENVRVNLGDRSYDILIGRGLLNEAGAHIAPLLRRSRIAVISDETVAALHWDSLRGGLSDQGIEAEILALPPGEATKSWNHLQDSVEWLLAQKVERDDLVIAFGGGVLLGAVSVVLVPEGLSSRSSVEYPSLDSIM